MSFGADLVWIPGEGFAEYEFSGPGVGAGWCASGEVGFGVNIHTRPDYLDNFSVLQGNIGWHSLSVSWAGNSLRGAPFTITYGPVSFPSPLGLSFSTLTYNYMTKPQKSPPLW